ncbi:hypothetical protein B296_00018718 [Ensete ventricosum]|uniref:Uncharacterized protein n=1 Tax=Ensete ventricosum TaxID=4639 RepID=A0A427ASL9_ENSVE|nr:hypothetical protein B296_00018718 [Ensete ventricosum]
MPFDDLIGSDFDREEVAVDQARDDEGALWTIVKSLVEPEILAPRNSGSNLPELLGPPSHPRASRRSSSSCRGDRRRCLRSQCHQDSRAPEYARYLPRGR